MAMNIYAELKRPGTLTTPRHRAKYDEVFGEATRCNNRPSLIKRICWRMQADAEGDLSERASQRAASLADVAEIRTMAPGSYTSPSQPGPRACEFNSHRGQVVPTGLRRQPGPIALAWRKSALVHLPPTPADAWTRRCLRPQPCSRRQRACSCTPDRSPPSARR